MINSAIDQNNAMLAGAYEDMRVELLRLLTHKTGNPTVAEDLLHEVFRKALVATQAKGLPANVSAWLYTITKNTLTDFYRTQKPNTELPEDLKSNDNELTASMELAPCLLPLIQQLPDIYQAAITAADIEVRSLQSIADEESISLSAVKSRVSRGRQKLKKSLQACCEITLQRSGEIDDFKQKQPHCGCSQ